MLPSNFESQVCRYDLSHVHYNAKPADPREARCHGVENNVDLAQEKVETGKTCCSLASIERTKRKLSESETRHTLMFLLEDVHCQSK